MTRMASKNTSNYASKTGGIPSGRDGGWSPTILSLCMECVVGFPYPGDVCLCLWCSDCYSSSTAWCLPVVRRYREHCKISCLVRRFLSQQDVVVFIRTPSLTWPQLTFGWNCVWGSSTSRDWTSRESTEGDCSGSSSQRRWRKGLTLKAVTSVLPPIVSSIPILMYGPVKCRLVLWKPLWCVYTCTVCKEPE